MTVCAMCCVRGPRWRTGRIEGSGIDGQPQPEDLFGASQPGAQFIQLEMREPEMAKEALVQGLCMLASASQPSSDGCLSIALRPVRPRKGPVLRPARDPHHGDLLRGSFQTGEGSIALG